ncbi:hypothetical protein ACFL08_00995 [Patescibacteria group bacterium]
MWASLIEKKKKRRQVKKADFIAKVIAATTCWANKNGYSDASTVSRFHGVHKIAKALGGVRLREDQGVTDLKKGLVVIADMLFRANGECEKALIEESEIRITTNVLFVQREDDSKIWHDSHYVDKSILLIENSDGHSNFFFGEKDDAGYIVTFEWPTGIKKKAIRPATEEEIQEFFTDDSFKILEEIQKVEFI